jgi:Arc/MetJ family transcription regulator
MTVRTTIHLDDDLAARARRLAPRRKLNKLVSEALAEKVTALEREELERAMREGYQAVDRERAELDAEWRATEIEEWPA